MIEIDFIMLHGFLGLPSDWDHIIEDVKVDFDENKYKVNFYCPDYFNIPSLSPKNSLEKVADEFINCIRHNTRANIKVLIGYSLGGRLALHIFEKNPAFFSNLILISANPGIANEDQKLQREIQDKNWSELFLHNPWEEVVEKWNQQNVFEGSLFEPEREDTKYRRDLLGKALINWSLAKQQDKRNVIKENQAKIVWIAGDKDKKYIEITKNLYKEAPDVHYLILPESGHRVLFDNPHELSRSIYDQISKSLK
jgi:2-succinyl-6-hydroxy-2,4-cyclohexadiene-1-carboxylate synthase